ncbi:MAG: hypothetical protein WHS86_09445 [Desulfosoma sp.]
MTQKTFTSLVCCGCSCLCDDIDAVMEGDRVVETANACRWGAARFLGLKKFSRALVRARVQSSRRRPDARGRLDVSCAEAVSVCRDYLFSARRVVAYGLGQMSIEALQILMAGLRDRETMWIPSDGPLLQAFVETYSRHGPALTNLECVRNQADLVVFWGANPVRSTPRLLSRYALFPRGRFTERGAEDRKAWTVDIQTTEMERVTQMVTIPPDQEKACIQALRRAYRGLPLEAPPGVSAKTLSMLLGDVEKSRYRVFFFGRGPLYHAGGDAVLDELASWVTELGASAPTFLMPVPGDFNSMGFLQVFLSGGGLADPLWRVQGDVHGWEPRTGDVLLALSGDCFWFLTDDQKRAVRKHRIPVVALSAHETMTTAEADVVAAVGLQGLDVTGRASRLDGVTLCAEKLWDGTAASDAAVVRDLFELM